jgi:endoglucanase
MPVAQAPTPVAANPPVAIAVATPVAQAPKPAASTPTSAPPAVVTTPVAQAPTPVAANPPAAIAVATPVAQAPTPTASTPASAPAASNSVTPSTPLIGINVSGAEYSWETYPTTSDLDYLKSKGITLLRVPFAWEKMQPTLNGPLSPTELGKMRTFLTAVGARGMFAIIDMHNYARYNSNWATSGNIGPGQGNIIGSAAVPYSAYKDVWTKLATALKGQSGLVGYDIMNEPNKMPNASVWPTAAQNAVDGIRSVDMNTTIYVEGDNWAGARSWLTYNANLHIVDPANRLVYEAHLYFDDTSGTYTSTYDQFGATPTRGVEQLQPFLTWLQQNNAKGFIGEFGVPQDDPRWLVVLDNFMAALVANNVAGTYWAYTYRTPEGVSWWPNVGEKMAITPIQDWGTLQLSIITKYTHP